jgi:hypothetical protein
MLTRRVAAGLVGLLMVTGPVACTGGSDDETAPPPSPTASSAPSTGPGTRLSKPDARLVVRLEQGRGGLSKAARTRIQRGIGRAVGSWIQGGFLAGEYPRRNFAAAFHRWTHDAAASARRHQRFTSNATRGDDLTALVADKQQARVYLFTRQGHVGGATARVLLRLTAERRDGTIVTSFVKGNLYLTRGKSGWRIFGYDLQRRDQRR